MDGPRVRSLFTKLFWLDAIERIIGTVVESLLSFVTVGFPFFGVDWVMAASVSATAGAFALLKGVAAAVKADTDTASLTVDTKPL